MSGRFTNHGKAFKVLSLVLAFVLVIGASVAGTLAWLTAQTPTVTNTFTSAELFANPENDFTLWEHEAVQKNDGTYTLNSTKVFANTYELLPGVDIPKDPTVDVDNLKEYAYLYIKVSGLPMATGLTATIDTAKWTALGDKYPNVYVYMGEHANGQKVIEATETNPVTFTQTILTDNKITVASTFDANKAGSLSELKFEAYMVQATGNGANAAEAWVNTFGAP